MTLLLKERIVSIIGTPSLFITLKNLIPTVVQLFVHLFIHPHSRTIKTSRKMKKIVCIDKSSIDIKSNLTKMML